jgi:hypothetical protein
MQEQHSDSVSKDDTADDMKIQEELIHVNDGEDNLKDDREPKVSNLHIIPIIGKEWIWIFIGALFACAMGVVPPGFFVLLGTLFTTLATASPDVLL